MKFHRGKIFLKKWLVFWALIVHISRTVNARELNEAILKILSLRAFIWWYCEVLNMNLKKWLDITNLSPEPYLVLQISQTKVLPHLCRMLIWMKCIHYLNIAIYLQLFLLGLKTRPHFYPSWMVPNKIKLVLDQLIGPNLVFRPQTTGWILF